MATHARKPLTQSHELDRQPFNILLLDDQPSTRFENPPKLPCRFHLTLEVMPRIHDEHPVEAPVGKRQPLHIRLNGIKPPTPKSPFQHRPREITHDYFANHGFQVSGYPPGAAPGIQQSTSRRQLEQLAEPLKIRLPDETEIVIDARVGAEMVYHVIIQARLDALSLLSDKCTGGNSIREAR